MRNFGAESKLDVFAKLNVFPIACQTSELKAWQNVKHA